MCDKSVHSSKQYQALTKHILRDRGSKNIPSKFTRCFLSINTWSPFKHLWIYQKLKNTQEKGLSIVLYKITHEKAASQLDQPPGWKARRSSASKGFQEQLVSIKHHTETYFKPNSWSISSNQQTQRQSFDLKHFPLPTGESSSDKKNEY